MDDQHSHYRALNPEPIDVLSEWGMAIEACLVHAHKLVARLIAVHKGAEGYNGRGGIEDAEKLIWWAQRLQFEMQKEAAIAEAAEQEPIRGRIYES